MSASKWRYRADISWIVNDKSMALTEKAHRIRRQLRGIKPFHSREVRSVLEELITAAAAGGAVFEEALSNVYATCDYFGVWLAQ